MYRTSEGLTMLSATQKKDAADESHGHEGQVARQRVGQEKLEAALEVTREWGDCSRLDARGGTRQRAGAGEPVDERRDRLDEPLAPELLVRVEGCFLVVREA